MSSSNTYLQKLQTIRTASGKQKTAGLPDDVIISFLEKDPKLAKAIDMATREYESLRKEFESLLKQDEDTQVRELQKDYVNFYSDDTVNPYVALAAYGPWIITTCGAVIYDAGGYGMLGLGHAPDAIIAAMQKPHVMANIMTANYSQKRFTDRLFQEIGFSRPADKRKPFAKFLCLNSGSEAR
jgi:4-aminobutyrate aminotransferase-like enzyme